MAFDVKRITTTEEMQLAHVIRETVFSDEQGIPKALDKDGKDDSAIHVLIYHDNEAIATGRVYPLNKTEGHIARIAVLPQYRGQGLGKEVVVALETEAKKAGLQSLFLNAHEHLEAFYAGLGYILQPQRVHAGGYELIRMEKEI